MTNKNLIIVITILLLFLTVHLSAGGYYERFDTYPRTNIKRITEKSIESTALFDGMTTVKTIVFEDMTDDDTYTEIITTDDNQIINGYDDGILIYSKNNDELASISFDSVTGIHKLFTTYKKIISNYNDKGEIQKRQTYRRYDIDWILVETIEFEYLYDQLSRSYQIINGNEVNQIMYYYDAQERPLPAVQFINTSGQEEYHEGAYKIEISEIQVFDSVGKLRFVRSIHDAIPGYGSRTEYENLEEEYNNLVEDRFIFDSAGNILSHTIFTIHGEVYQMYLYEYEYDRRLNWIHKSIWSEKFNSKIRSTYRDIEYY